ncbi:ParB/RepB/Spo0J family partition protein [Streptomyces sp. NPDC127106]|uniref:ParB/RepB/Spo0J family partition protein n=1 Tax=Streptomyces sp. NPDC127106 TaxID=3345360 RepID=UPI00362C8F4D
MAGRLVSFADMADDEVADEPGVTPGPPARWIATDRCLPNPRNPRDELGDLSDLAGIKARQLQSCLAITPRAYLRLWPEDRERLGAGPDDVVIINGNRRQAAAKKYGRDELLVVVDDGIATSRASVLRAAYDENTGRKDFDPIEEAKAVMEIVAQYPTAKEAAEAEGWSQPWISQRKNLLKLHPELQQEVRAKASGGEGLSINVARRLGSVKGISDMGIREQRQALADLLADDAAASKARKEARRKVREEVAPPSAPEAPPSESTDGPETSTGEEFSAENPPGAPVPEPRSESSPPASAARATEAGNAGAEADAEMSAWLMPEEAVRHLSSLFIERATATGRTPEEVMRETLDRLRQEAADSSS